VAAITSYATLIDEVKTYCARTDSTFSARMPLFVGLSEDRIYYGHGDPNDPLHTAPLRSKIMEVSGTVTMTDGEGTLPDDILDIRRLSRDGDDLGMVYLPPVKFQEQRALTWSGNPYFHTTEGTTIRTMPAMTGTLDLLYYKRFPAVSATNDGPMIQEHGTVYFNAVMFEAMTFMQEIELAAGWLSRLRATIAGINRTAASMRSGGTRVRSAARAIG